MVVFAHDQPDVEAKHFTNPNGAHDINDRDRFENLLSTSSPMAPASTYRSLIEQRALEAFLARHPNITAYFHGNSNWNEFYDWQGPGRSVVLHTFRVDSPMKGRQSSTDESSCRFLSRPSTKRLKTITTFEVPVEPESQDAVGPGRMGLRRSRLPS